MPERNVQDAMASRLRFSGKFRDECLSLEWFRSSREARVVIESWRQHYNTVRPDSSLGYLTPHEFKQQYHPLPTRPSYRNERLEKAGQVRWASESLACCHKREAPPLAG